VVEVGLEVLQVLAADSWPQFAFESAVEAFDLALDLGAVRTAVAGVDAQANQRRLEPRDTAVVLTAGAEGIVAEDAAGQAA
jgi:hypothetical protein